MKSTIVFAILLLFIAPAVFADSSSSIGLTSPVNGNTIDPIRDGFSYIPSINDPVKECGLYVDSAIIKSVYYNDTVNRQMLYFNPEIDDGAHNWSVYCTKQNGDKIISEVRNVTVKNKEDVVKITASGVFRGSMEHEFSFANIPTQESVVVKKLAAGDYILIDFKIPPSTITKELYVQRFSSDNGKKYLILEDQKKNQVYKIFEGNATTINITTSGIDVKFIGLELNRATVMVSSKLSKANMADAESQDVNSATAGNNASNNALENNASENNTQEKPAENPVVAPANNSGEKPAGANALPDQKLNDSQNSNQEQKPGLFKRFLSWLTSIFGA